MEQYKAIKGFEGLYEVSNFGNVKSLNRIVLRSDGRKRTIKERLLKGSKNNCGYLVVCLLKGGNEKQFQVHQLVAITFLNHTPNGNKIVVDHIDNNPLNNNLNNLQLISNRENLSKDKKGGHSKYIGVTWDNNAKKWRSSIYVNGKSKYLGIFIDELKAANAYQKELNNIVLL
jgi:hypothetical protein